MGESNDGRGRALAPSLAVAATGAVWGIYWLPLRHLQALGLDGNWATAAFFIVSLPPALALAWVARRELRAHGRRLIGLALLNGAVFSLYSDAYTHTTVFNVLFLFYLSPVWSVVIARVSPDFVPMGERAGAARLGCVALGLCGLVTMLSAGGGWPIPRNIGDWMALVSGMLWAVATIRIRRDQQIGAVANSVAFLLGGIWPALLIAALAGGAAHFPSGETMIAAWPLLLAVAWLIWTPSQLLLYWGVRRISPVRTGILLMTELVSGVATAAWLSGDPISWRQAVGGALILLAGLGDVVTTRERSTPAPVPLPAVQD